MTRSAVILAAGMGTRLQTEFPDMPKGFLRLGDTPIVEESVQLLAAAGIRDIVVVTGYQAAYYDELQRRHRGLMHTVHNPAFAESGSMYSLYCARDAVDGSFLLLESDLIYEPRALRTLLEAPAADVILLSGPTDAGDEVFVSTRQGNLMTMSKDRDALSGEIAGELVGISKISPELFEIMQRVATKAFEASLNFDYETDCLVAAASEREVFCALVPDLVWSEIDDPDHLRRARDQIYPEIHRRTVRGESL